MAVNAGFKAKPLKDAGAHVSRKVAPIKEADLAVSMVTVRIPRLKRKRWHLAALDRDTSVNALIIEAMDKLLGDDQA